MMEKDGVFVMMPVRCIGDICKNCPNLNIDNDVQQIYGNGEIVATECNLYCRGVRRCTRIKEMIDINQKHVEPLDVPYEYWKCGSCGKEIGFQHHYCEWCGRKVKWDE